MLQVRACRRAVALVAAIGLFLPAPSYAATTISEKQWDAIASANAIQKCVPNFMPSAVSATYYAPGSKLRKDGIFALKPTTIPDEPFAPFLDNPGFTGAGVFKTTVTLEKPGTLPTEKGEGENAFTAETQDGFTLFLVQHGNSFVDGFVQSGIESSALESASKDVSMNDVNTKLLPRLKNAPGVMRCGMKVVRFRSPHWSGSMSAFALILAGRIVGIRFDGYPAV